MALQPLLGIGRPQKRLQSSLFQPFSSILISVVSVVHPSEQHPPICFLVFPLVWNFTLKTCFVILSSILIIWPANPSLLILIFYTTFRSLYGLYSSFFNSGCQRPPSCVGPYILPYILLSNVFSIFPVVCVRVQVTLP